jgi:hypothetical protein
MVCQSHTIHQQVHFYKLRLDFAIPNSLSLQYASISIISNPSSIFVRHVLFIDTCSEVNEKRTKISTTLFVT